MVRWNKPKAVIIVLLFLIVALTYIDQARAEKVPERTSPICRQILSAHFTLLGSDGSTSTANVKFMGLDIWSEYWHECIRPPGGGYGDCVGRVNTY